MVNAEGQPTALDFGSAPGDHCPVTNIFTRARLTCALALLFLPAGIVSRDLGAQEIGLYGADGTTDLAEIEQIRRAGRFTSARRRCATCPFD